MHSVERPAMCQVFLHVQDKNILEGVFCNKWREQNILN